MLTWRAGAGIDYQIKGRAVRSGAQRECPQCQAETTVHGFLTPDGLWLETHHCPAHGAVVPAKREGR